MYTLYQTLESMVEKGISHTRSNGEMVRRLKKEEADFVWYVEKESQNTDDWCFFIIEYEKGDVITLEDYMGKNWYRVLGDINDNELLSITYNLNLICETWVQQGNVWPKKLHNLLKTLLPLVFKYMSNATLAGNRRLYFLKYSWILEKMGKTVNQYVKQSLIDEYVSSMIECYEISAVEALLKEKGVKISDENVLDFARAKSELAETVEIAKKIVADKKYDYKSQDFFDAQYFSKYTEKTPCGSIRILITLNGGFKVGLYLTNTTDSVETIVDITEECQEFAELYESL